LILIPTLAPVSRPVMAYHVQGTAANVAKATQALALLCGAKKNAVCIIAGHTSHYG